MRMRAAMRATKEGLEMNKRNIIKIDHHFFILSLRHSFEKFS